MVCPTYFFLHLRHVMRYMYMMSRELHVKGIRILKVDLVRVLLKELLMLK